MYIHTLYPITEQFSRAELLSPEYPTQTDGIALSVYPRTTNLALSPHWCGACMDLSLEASPQLGGSRRCCGHGCSSNHRPLKKYIGSNYNLDVDKYADAPAFPSIHHLSPLSSNHHCPDHKAQ